MKLRTVNLMFFTLFFFNGFTTNLFGQWSQNPAINTPVCTDLNYQVNPVIVSDGSGGGILAWLDRRGDFQQIYTSRIDRTGTSLWQPGGQPIAYNFHEGGFSGEYLPAITSDGHGGAIIASVRDYDSYNYVYCQRVDSQGNLMWGEAGLNITTDAGVADIDFLRVGNDGLGGGIIVRNKSRFNYYIYAQRISAAGNALWGQGKLIASNGAANLETVKTASGSDGDVIVAWADMNNIYVQRIDREGQVSWEDNGVPVFPGSGSGDEFVAVHDGDGGVIIIKNDDRTGSFRLYGQKIDEFGVVRWSANEVDVNSVNSGKNSLVAVSDNAGGVIVAWQDRRDGVGNIFAQRLNHNGELPWATEGIAISGSNNTSEYPAIVEDGSGGAIILWSEYNIIYAQHVDKNGNSLWQPGGVMLTIVNTGEGNLVPRVISDGSGGAIVTWSDYRNNNSDIIAQRIDRLGFLGLDETAPTIDHLTPETVTENTPVTIAADVTDDLSGVDSCLLVYKQGGRSDSTSLLMLPTGLGSVSATIPDSEVTKSGIHYYIYAVDSSGNTSREPATGSQSVRIHLENLVNESSQPANTFQMISLPLIPGNASVNEVLADDLGAYNRKKWRLFQWDQSREDYIEFNEPGFNDFAPGTGFWLITKTGKTIDSGPGMLADVSQHVTIQLNQGWNVVSNPFTFRVDWEDVVKNDCSASLWDFRGSEFVSAVHLEPWKSYFLYGWSEQASIAIPPKEAVVSTAKEHLVSRIYDQAEWYLKLSARTHHFKDALNVIGIAKQASAGWDALDQTEPPRSPGNYVSLYFPHDDWGAFSGNYAVDFRPFTDDGMSGDFEVCSNIENSTTTLSFDGIESIPERYAVYLIDQSAGIMKDLRKTGHYDFLAAGKTNKRKFSLLVSHRDSLGTVSELPGLIPETYQLYQNFPNPFNAATEIKYATPYSGNIRLTIFNIMGERVKTVIDNQFQEKGYHNIIWDGTDDRQRQVAGGIYFYQIRVDSYHFIMTKKMVFVK